MQYRHLRNFEERVSLLGYGCMRFPVREDDPSNIVEEEAEKLIDQAIASGITYFDTAYPYHGGRSEEVSSRILRKYPRSSYYLADKLPIWLIKKDEDTKRYFEEQLVRCQVEYFDFYLVHSLDRNKYRICEQYHVFDTLKRLKEEGKIRHLGFSFHDDAGLLEQILDDHSWDFVQIQLNYLDWGLQDAKHQYEILAARGLPCMVMEPVRGGVLASLPENAAAYLKDIHPEASYASWAIRFAASLPNVLCVLSGMASQDVIEENVRTVSNAGEFRAEEVRALRLAAREFRKGNLIGCTGCGYCRECPKGVNIPKIFAGYNQYLVGKDRFQLYNAYVKLKDEEKVRNCIKCGSCMTHCPQGIPITEKLGEVQALVDEINANRPDSWFEL